MTACTPDQLPLLFHSLWPLTLAPHLPLNDFHCPIPSPPLPTSSPVIDWATCSSTSSATPTIIHRYIHPVYLFRQATTNASHPYTPNSGDISQLQSRASLVGSGKPSIKPSIHPSQTTASSPLPGNSKPIPAAYGVSSPYTIVMYPAMKFSAPPPSPYLATRPSSPARHVNPPSYERSSSTALRRRLQSTLWA